MTSWKDRLRYISLRGKVPVTKGWCYENAALVRNPGTNEGIPTGRGAGIFVLDVDPRHGGDVTRRELEEKHGPLPATYQVGTPGGGTHDYFKYCAQGEDRIKNSAGEIGPGIDIRGDGGYVVAPGSKLDGKAWKELTPDTEPADAPDWLQVRVLGLRKNKKANSDKAVAPVGEVPAEGITDGRRNDTLFKLGAGMRARGLSEDAILAALLAENKVSCKPPLSEAEVLMLAGSASSYEQGSRNAYRPWHEFTSLELSDRFAASAVNKILYAVDDQAWFDYVDGIWCENRAGASRQISQYLRGELPQEPDKSDEKLHRAWKRLKDKLWGKRITTEVEFFARIQPTLGTLREDFDRNEWIIGLPDAGALDLRTGKVRPATPEDRMTQRLNVMPAAVGDETTCSNWLKYLRSAHPDEGTRKFLQMFFGYCLTASDREQCIVFFIGIGGSGKQTMLEPITTILGHYYKELGLSALITKTNDDRRNNYLAQLVGVRLATIGEMPFAEILDTNILKHLSGSNNKICARRLGHQPFEFTPQYKILICSNTAPNLSLVDDSIRQRIKVVPFSVKFRDTDQQDKHLPEKLLKELPGILRWMIDGCLEWQRTPGGLLAPKSVREGTESYLKAADIFEGFLRDKVVIDPNGTVPTAILFSMWKEYAIHNNYVVGNEKSFKELLTSKRRVTSGVYRFQGQTGRGYKGIRLPKNQEELFQQEQTNQGALSYA